MNSEVMVRSLDNCIIALSKTNDELNVLGIKKAIAEKAYIVKQAQEILNLKSNRQSVALVLELVKANKKVAELRLQMDIAESEYYNCISKIENLRIKINVIKSKVIKRHYLTSVF